MTKYLLLVINLMTPFSVSEMRWQRINNEEFCATRKMLLLESSNWVGWGRGAGETWGGDGKYFQELGVETWREGTYWRGLYFHHHHHKHQGLDPLIRSVSTVTAARANASSVFQLFSFLAVCSGMVSKGFGFVAFFASVKASSVCIHLYFLVCL